MMPRGIAWTLLASACLAVVRGYPVGAPLEACESMFPSGHHVDAQDGTPPYTLTADKISFSGGEVITVWLNSTRSPPSAFMGFFLQARTATDCGSSEPVGSFSTRAEESYVTVQCKGRQKSAITQSLRLSSSSTKVTWIAPNSTTGHIYFLAAVVEEMHTFWVNIYSNVFRDTKTTVAFPSHGCNGLPTWSDGSSVTPTTSVTPTFTASATPPPVSHFRQVLVYFLCWLLVALCY